MSRHIAHQSADELESLVRTTDLDDREILEVLRNPYCSARIAEMIAASRKNLGTQAVREKLAGFPGLNFTRAMNLVGSLTWTSLLNLAQAHRTPPVVRRQTEKKLVNRIPSMTLGEKVALARRAHRALFKALINGGDEMVLTALLDNPRLVENDLVVLINTKDPTPDFLGAVARHRKWGSFIGVRRAIVESPQSPLPLALSVLVQLPRSEQRKIAARTSNAEEVRKAAAALRVKADSVR
jgi:hypothetical protein